MLVEGGKKEGRHMLVFFSISEGILSLFYIAFTQLDKLESIQALISRLGISIELIQNLNVVIFGNLIV